MRVGFGYGYGLPKAVKGLLIANAAIFVASYLFGLAPFLNSFFGLRPYLVTHYFMIWQFFTYMFLHGGIGHIGFNMFALWMFGSELEYNWGTKDFLKYYIVCGIGGGVLVWLTSFTALSSQGAITIGASGAIFGLLVAYGLMWPDRMIFVFGILPMKALHFVIIFGLLDLMQGLSRVQSGIAYFAHVGGGVTGFIYLKYGWRIQVHLQSFIKKRRFKVIQGGRKRGGDDTRHDDFEDEVDRILDKIARLGMESLTDDERRILERASRRRR